MYTLHFGDYLRNIVDEQEQCKRLKIVSVKSKLPQVEHIQILFSEFWFNQQLLTDFTTLWFLDAYKFT